MASRPKRKHFKNGVRRQMSTNGVKYIKVPATVTVMNTLHQPDRAVEDGSGKKMTLSLRQIVIFALEHEMFFKTSGDMRRKSDKLAAWADELVEGKVVPIAEDWLAALNQALETRGTIPYARWIVRQCQPIFDALENAKDRAEDFDPPAEESSAVPETT